MLMPAAKYFLFTFLVTAVLGSGFPSVQAQSVQARIDASITGVIPAVFEFDNEGEVVGVLEEQMVYRIFLPGNYDPQVEYPMILFLHGSGQSGSDNIDQIGTVLNTMILETDSNRPAILVAPQLAQATGWRPSNPMDRNEELLDLVLDEYSIDTNRMYLTGLSMGGFGATDYMTYYHQDFPGKYRFAAAAITAGAFISERSADTLSETPIWFSHGGRDTVVDPSFSLNAFNLVVGRPFGTEFMPDSGLTIANNGPTDAEGIHRLTIYPTRQHGSWGPYYSSQDVYDWLFAQSLPEALEADLQANAAGDYVAAAGGATNTLTVPSKGWSFWGSDAANGGNELPLVAGLVGNQGADYLGFHGVSSANTASILGTNTADSDDFEIFSSGDLNNAVVGTDLLIYPGQTADSHVIIRYTVSDPTGVLIPGTGEVTGSFRDLTVPSTLNSVNGGSVDVFVYHNSTQLFIVDQAPDVTTRGVLSQSKGTFNLTGLTLADGDTIDFVVFNNGNFVNDETALQANVFAEVSDSVLYGDVDLNGAVNFLDITPFIAILSAGVYQAEADCNMDGAVTFSDIAPFIEFLLGS